MQPTHKTPFELRLEILQTALTICQINNAKDGKIDVEELLKIANKMNEFVSTANKPL